MRIKEHIDIEKLLEWAYRLQCVDRVIAQQGNDGSGGGSPAWLVAGENFLKYGCRIDGGSAVVRSLGAKAPEDAERLHAVVLALGAIWLDEAANVWDQARAEAIGYTIDRTKSGWWLRSPDGQGAPLTDVALPVLLIIHARNATRPDWCEGYRNPGAAAARDAGDRDRWGRRRKAVDTLTPEDVAYRRAEYSLWHAALVWLAARLEGELDDYEAKSPMAPAAPWGRAAEKAA